MTQNRTGCSAAELLYPADPTKDNGPAIREHWAANKRLPSGRFYVRSTIASPKHGCKLLGQSQPAYVKPDASWDGGTTDNATVLIWNGAMDAGQTMIKVCHANCRIEEIGLIGQPLEKVHYEPPSPVTLITLYDPGSPMQPVSNTSIERVMLGSAQRGIYAAPGTHCDHVNITDTVCSRLVTCVAMDNSQSVEWNIDNLVALGPGGDTVFDVRDGGRLDATIVLTQPWGSIIKIGKPEADTNYMNLGFYKIRASLDNSARVTNSIVERRAYAGSNIWIDISGWAASAVTCGAPIVLNAASRLHVDIKHSYGAGDFTYSQGAP